MTAPREPQQERSRITRDRLLEATVEALAETGWSRTTVALVAARAGVTRGAAQHHYPTREDLVAAALTHVADRYTAEMPSTVTEPPGPGRTREVVVALDRLHREPLFRAAVQLWAAATADVALQQQILPVEAEIAARLHRAVVRLLGVDDTRPEVRAAVQAALAFSRGLGLEDLLTDDASRWQRIVERFAVMLHADLLALDAFVPGRAGTLREDTSDELTVRRVTGRDTHAG